MVSLHIYHFRIPANLFHVVSFLPRLGVSRFFFLRPLGSAVPLNPLPFALVACYGNEVCDEADGVVGASTVRFPPCPRLRTSCFFVFRVRFFFFFSPQIISGIATASVLAAWNDSASGGRAPATQVGEIKSLSRYGGLAALSMRRVFLCQPVAFFFCFFLPTSNSSV